MDYVRRILVVGNAASEESILLLQQAGYDIDTADSIEEAASLLRTTSYTHVLVKPELFQENAAIGNDDTEDLTAMPSPCLPSAEVEWQMMIADTVANSTEANLAYLDPSFNFLWVNAAYAKTFAHGREQLVGRNYFEVFSKEKQLDIFEHVRETGQAHIAKEEELDHHINSRSGATYWNWSLVPIRRRHDPVGTTRGFVLTLVDVTQDVQTKHEIERLREKAEKTAREISAVFEALADAVIIYDANGAVSYANPAAAQALGVDPAVAGWKSSIAKLMMRQSIECDTTPSEMPSQKALLGETVKDEESCFVSPNGRRLDIIASASPLISDGQVVGAAEIWHDVTERRQAERALRESESRYRSLFSTMSEGFSLIGVEHNHSITAYRFLETNSAFETLVGLVSDEIIGKTLQEVIPSLAKDWNEALARVANDGRPATLKGYNERTDRYFDAVVYSPAAGQLALLLMDTTERELAEKREREAEKQNTEFYRRTILAATNGKLVISDSSDINSMACDTIASWNVENNDNLSEMHREVRRLTEKLGMPEQKVMDFVACAVEAATNATKHACGGRAYLCRRDNSLVYVVTDSGPGIGAMALPEVALVRGYSTAGTLGMGYKVMLNLADKVYLSTGPSGTTVAIEMSLYESHNGPEFPIKQLPGWTD